MNLIFQLGLALALFGGNAVQAGTKHEYLCVGTVVSETRKAVTTPTRTVVMDSEMFGKEHQYLSEKLTNANSEGHFEIRSDDGQIAIEVVYISSRWGTVRSQAVALPGSQELSLSATLSSPNGSAKGSSSLSCELND